MGTTGDLDVSLPVKTLSASGQADGDLYYDNVVSLLHFNGGDGTTTFTDQIPARSWIAVGNAQISTAQSLYGGSSGLFDGTGDVITCPDHVDFDLGSEDFTVELNIRTGASLAAVRRIFCKTNNASDYAGLVLLLNSAQLVLYASSNGTSWDICSAKVIKTALSTNTWYTIAISRNGANWNAWVDGAAAAGSTFPLVTSPGTSLYRGTQSFAIGGSSDALAGYLGHVEEFRLTKGVGRYPAAYTPATKAFPDEEAPVGRLEITLPRKILNQQPATSVADITLPTKTLSATGAVGVVAQSARILPNKALVATGVTGVVGNLTKSLPTKTLIARVHPHVEIALPSKLLVATGVHGVTGGSSIILPAKRLTATGITGRLSVADIILPSKVLSATGIVGATGSLDRSLPKLRLSASGFGGKAGSLSITLPAKTLLASGYGVVTGTANIVLPKKWLTASGITVIASTYRTWALNLRKGALTSYDNFNFNSFANFNGYTLAAGSNGVVVLGTQDLDNTTAITARVRSGKDSFGSSVHKRVPRAYIGYTTDGDAYFRMITAEGGERTYLLSWNHATGLQQRRVQIGKGPKSRWFQWEVENLLGADLEIANIMLYPTKLRRRVQ